MKKIALIGATGNIGRQTLSLIAEDDSLQLFAFSFHNSVTRAKEIIQSFRPKLVCVTNDRHYSEIKEFAVQHGTLTFSGTHGLREIIERPEIDMIVMAVVGAAGIFPTNLAVRTGKIVALANKESLVAAGELMIPAAIKHKTKIIPIDSEHSAIYQCLAGQNGRVNRLILTASGGAFRDYTKDQIRHLKASDALKHPNWNMGKKITIDSATLMNKGFEMMEAKWLFSQYEDRIKILIHPQSIVHSMVEYEDHSIVAQLGFPDMHAPIAYALHEGRRVASELIPSLDYAKMATLTFSEPDLDRFPCLQLALDASLRGGIMPAVLNAANDVLVAAYLEEKISFYDISSILEQMLQKKKEEPLSSVEQILAVTEEVQQEVRSIIDRY